MSEIIAIGISKRRGRYKDSEIAGRTGVPMEKIQEIGHREYLFDFGDYGQWPVKESDCQGILSLGEIGKKLCLLE